jgi:hypothetical protein
LDITLGVPACHDHNGSPVQQLADLTCLCVEERLRLALHYFHWNVFNERRIAPKLISGRFFIFTELTKDRMLCGIKISGLSSFRGEAKERR